MVDFIWRRAFIVAPGAITLSVLLSSCAPEPRRSMVVDGYELIVGREPAENVWMAAPALSSPQVFRSGDNANYVRNLKAIRAASGCEVVADSVRHHDHSATTALVDCSSS